MLGWDYFQLLGIVGEYGGGCKTECVQVYINQYSTQCNKVLLRCFRALLDNYGALKHRWLYQKG